MARMTKKAKAAAISRGLRRSKHDDELDEVWECLMRGLTVFETVRQCGFSEARVKQLIKEISRINKLGNPILAELGRSLGGIFGQAVGTGLGAAGGTALGGPTGGAVGGALGGFAGRTLGGAGGEALGRFAEESLEPVRRSLERSKLLPEQIQGKTRTTRSKKR